MKKNILKILIIPSVMFLQISVFGDNGVPGGGFAPSDPVLTELKKISGTNPGNSNLSNLAKDGKTFEPILTSINKNLVDIFVGKNGTFINDLHKDLNNLLTTPSDTSFTSNKFNDPSPGRFNNAITKLFTISDAIVNNVSTLLRQEVFYDTQVNLSEKNKTNAALLIKKVDGGPNNINYTPNNISSANNILGINTQGANIKEDLNDNAALGSLRKDFNIPSDTGNQDADLINANTLLGIDGYKDDEQLKRAKLFINQILQATPLPPMFIIPPKPASGNVTFYLPTADKTNLTPYTAVNDIELNDYDKMVAGLTSNNLFQEYKAKIHSLLGIRSVFIKGILDFLAEREKIKDPSNPNDPNAKSLVEQEKSMASVGLTQQYYDNLKKQSIADVNLEMLYTLNKIVYFLNKIHQDNERTQLMIAVTGMRLQNSDQQDDMKYIQPITSLIRNKCWKNNICQQAVGTSPPAGVNANKFDAISGKTDVTGSTPSSNTK